MVFWSSTASTWKMNKPTGMERSQEFYWVQIESSSKRVNAFAEPAIIGLNTLKNLWFLILYSVLLQRRTCCEECNCQKKYPRNFGIENPSEKADLKAIRKTRVLEISVWADLNSHDVQNPFEEYTPKMSRKNVKYYDPPTWKCTQKRRWQIC